MTITTPNSFKIGLSTTEIRGVSKVTLAMNNPVGLIFHCFGRRAADAPVRARIWPPR